MTHPHSPIEIAPWPIFDAASIQAATDVLRSGRVNYWTSDLCQRFETAFAEYLNVSHAVALSNGTVALELALEVLGIRAGDEVIVPCRSFYATASAVARLGAVPVFADIDLASQTLTPDTISPLITPQTKAIIVVHLAGWPAPMPEIMALARAHQIKVIEDCAQAHGAAILNQKVGTFGDIGAFSFCQDKIMTTGGEGGMLVMQDSDLYTHAWSIKDHGKSLEKVAQRTAEPEFQWLHERIGTNYRLTPLQAAIGLEQLGLLDTWIAARQANAAALTQALTEVPGVRHITSGVGVSHAYYKYYLMLDAAVDRAHVMRSLQAVGVPCSVGACPYIQAEAAFAHVPTVVLPHYPNALQWANQGVMLLIHPGLSDLYFETVIHTLRHALQMQPA